MSARPVPLSSRLFLELSRQERQQHTEDCVFFGVNIVAMSSKSWPGLTSNISDIASDRWLDARVLCFGPRALTGEAIVLSCGLARKREPAVS